METPSHIRELQRLWQDEYGEVLTDGEATIVAERLLRFAGLLVSTLSHLSTETDLDESNQ